MEDVNERALYNRDVCITIGGDNTFLNAAKALRYPQKTSILGINSCTKYQSGKLCDQKLEFDKNLNQSKEILYYLNQVGTPEEDEHV